MISNHYNSLIMKLMLTIIPIPQKRKLEASGVVNAYNPPNQEKGHPGACAGVEGQPGHPKHSKTLSQKITEIRTQKHSNICPKNESSQKQTIPNHYQMISEHNVYTWC